MSNTSSVKRNANLELLRILSMIMVTFLHALGKADLLGNLAGSFNIPHQNTASNKFLPECLWKIKKN